MEKLKCGVVGLGRIGWCTHCKEINERHDAELTCVIEPVAKRREEATKAFPTMEEVINNLHLDLLVIASASKLHFEQTIKGLNAGINILVEKSMAETLKEMDILNLKRKESKWTPRKR